MLTRVVFLAISIALAWPGTAAAQAGASLVFRGAKIYPVSGGNREGN